MKILYASQTGNSVDVAERIWRRLKCLKVPTSIDNICDYNVLNLLQEELVVFVCSTTGQGDCPDDMLTFWKFLLRKNLPKDSLRGLTFGVVGLGDSSYSKYNVVAKKLEKRLLQLGSRTCFSVVLCDDQHELGYDAAFEPWLKGFVETILPSYYPSCRNYMYNENYLLPPKYKLKFLNDGEGYDDSYKNGLKQQQKKDDLAKVLSNSRVTADDHFQDVRLIEFHIGENTSYRPGDVVVLQPENDEENVNDFIDLFSEPLDKPFVLQPTDPETTLPRNLPMPCTLRYCITSFWDIQGIPRRSFFDILWHFSNCDIEREKLQEFTTAEGQEELYSYCNRPRRNTLEVLQDFPNTTPHIPLEYYFDLIPCIRSRSFSIASSLEVHPKELHVLVAVVKYRTKLFKPRRGLCSTWLSKLKPGAVVPFSTKGGTIALPTSDSPLVMVGPGTGCAPFRGFIEERSLMGLKDNVLFFGCRYEKKDFLCEKDWLHFTQQGSLRLFTAFSRDQDDKIYVQHRMLEESVTLWRAIDERSGCLYIAGNSKNMPMDVRDALLKIVKKEGKMDSTEAQAYLQKLESQKRLTIETWS